LVVTFSPAVVSPTIVTDPAPTTVVSRTAIIFFSETATADRTGGGKNPRRGISPPNGKPPLRESDVPALVPCLLLPSDMNGSRCNVRFGVFLAWAVAASASCATGVRQTAAAATPVAVDPRSCVVQIFPTAPPFQVEDLGPIQAPCLGGGRSWATCGIDQPNLREVACSSGADTVFGLYEVVGPSKGLFSTGIRVMHARLGRRQVAPSGASRDESR
jgi:hypothetical protein